MYNAVFMPIPKSNMHAVSNYNAGCKYQNVTW